MIAGHRKHAHPAKNSSEIAAVHLSEFQALRQEINNRQTLSYTIIAADLLSVTSGLTVVNQYPGILVALAVLSSLLWLFWQVQTMQIYRIAAYIALQLRPRLMQIYGQSMLDWESYVRRLTWSSDIAAEALAGTRMPPYLISRTIDGVYISLLLGGLAPVVLAVASLAQVRVETFSTATMIAGVLAVALWIYAVCGAILVRHTTREISRIIIEAQRSETK